MKPIKRTKPGKTEGARTDFTKRVIAVIGRIPRGKVASYGQIAALAGKPHGARGVAWILHSSSRARNLPWQRVLGASGKISFPEGSREHHLQRSRLEAEGVVFGEGGAVAESCRWERKATKSRARPGAARPR